MPSFEQKIGLVLEMKGQESVKALDATISDLKKELEGLVVAWEKNELALGEFTQEAATLQGQIIQTEGVMNTLRGKGSPGSGASGQGILGASYALQDFVSQLGNGPGGFARAIGSVQNNIPQILMGAGLSNPMIAAISAISLGIGAIAPMIVEAFGQQSQKEIDAAKEKLKEFEAEVKKVHDAFEKMKDKPTEKEDEFTENLKAIFEAPGNAELISKHIMASLKPAIPIGMTDEEIEAAAVAAGKKKASNSSQAAPNKQLRE